VRLLGVSRANAYAARSREHHPHLAYATRTAVLMEAQRDIKHCIVGFYNTTGVSIQCAWINQ